MKEILLTGSPDIMRIHRGNRINPAQCVSHIDERPVRPVPMSEQYKIRGERKIAILASHPNIVWSECGNHIERGLGSTCRVEEIETVPCVAILALCPRIVAVEISNDPDAVGIILSNISKVGAD